MVLAREDAPFARESAYFFDESKTGNPNTIAGGLSLIVCTVAAFAGAYGSLLICGWVRRRRSLEEDVVSPKDVELRVPATPRGAEVVLATAGARPDLGEVARRADAQLGLGAEIMAGGPDGRGRETGPAGGRRADDVVPRTGSDGRAVEFFDGSHSQAGVRTRTPWRGHMKSRPSAMASA